MTTTPRSTRFTLSGFRTRVLDARGLAHVALFGSVLALGGCLSVPIPQAEADPARFFVLSTVTPSAAAAPNLPATAALRLQHVEVASYLRSRPMIVRRGENEIQFREFARWGEPLDVGIGRVLREELLAQGAAGHVIAPGATLPGTTQAARSVSVRVLACEGGADGAVYFRAVWEMTGAEGVEAKRGDFRAANLRWDGKSEGSLAAQLSVAVSALAGEIAASLRK
jgi:uncharacterized lipoprotein YmbA